MNVLFFLPGSDLPQHGWFDNIPQFDKLVHFGLFMILLSVWTSAFTISIPEKIWPVLGLALLYGLLVEIIQKLWVPGRSFDLFDVVADMMGSVTGVFLNWFLYKKNKPL